MPTAGEVKIIMAADAASFSAAMDKMKSQLKQFEGSVGSAAGETKKQFREAQGSIAVLGEEIGVHLPRHVRSFVASLPGVASAMSAAFTGVAVIAIGKAIFEAGEKIAEFVKKNQEAAAKMRMAQEEFGTAVNKTYNSFRDRLLEAGIKADELRGDHLAALHKQLQLIDSQGFNQLESAFKSLDTAANKTFENIKNNWLSVVSQFSFNQASGFKGTLERFGGEYSSLLAQGKGSEAQNLLNTTQQREEQNRADIIAMRRTGLLSDSANLYFKDPKLAASLGRLRSRGITDWSDETYAGATQVTSALEAQQNIAAFQRRLTAMQKQNAITEAQPSEPSGWPVTGPLSSRFEKIRQSTILDPEKEVRAQDALERSTEAINKLFLEQAEDVTHTGERWQQFNRELAKGYEDAATFSAKYQELQIRIKETTGVLSPHAAAIQTAKINAEEYLAKREKLRDLQASIENDTSLTPVQKQTQSQQVGNQISALDAQWKLQHAQIQQLIDSSEALIQLRDSAQRLAQSFADLPTHITQIFDQTLRNLNQTIVEALSGNKSADFKKVGTGMLKGVANAGIEYVEGRALSAILGKNPMAKPGSRDNPLWVRVLQDAQTAGGAVGGVIGVLLHKLGIGGSGGGAAGAGAAGTGAGDVVGGVLGSVLSALPAFAGGGPIPSNMPALVGENGPDIFMPASSGRIIPSSQAFGHTFNMSVDARGSADPAATEAAVHRAMAPYMRQFPAMAVASVRDYNSRVPRSSRVGR